MSYRIPSAADLEYTKAFLSWRPPLPKSLPPPLPPSLPPLPRALQQLPPPLPKSPPPLTEAEQRCLDLIDDMNELPWITTNPFNSNYFKLTRQNQWAVDMHTSMVSEEFRRWVPPPTKLPQTLSKDSTVNSWDET